MAKATRIARPHTSAAMIRALVDTPATLPARREPTKIASQTGRFRSVGRLARRG